MALQFDFAGYGSDGTLVVVVEAKARRGANSMWASEFRRNLLEKERLPSGALFVVATPRAVYIWDQNSDRDELATYEVTGDEVFGGYLSAAGLEPDDFIEPFVFEMVVSRWLQDLACGQLVGGPHEGISKLADVLRGGRVVAQVAA